MVKVIHNKSLYLLILAGLLLPASNAFADGNTTDFSITVNPSLSLAVSSASVNFEITPTMAGAYNSANFTVTSATNNVYGYTLTMSTNNVNLTSNTVNPNTGTNPTIPTLTETQAGISAADFQASTDSSVLNHYGVAIGANNFNAMKTTKQVKKTTANNASGVDNTVITLASKLDLATVPGTYSTTLNFQIVANPLPGGLEEAYQNAGKSKKTINGKEYYAMQDMTSTICGNTTLTGDMIEVYDSRDDNVYHIGKLEDNKCWLLDNLALDITDSGVQSNMDSTNTNATDASLGYLFGVTSRDPLEDPNGRYAIAGVADSSQDTIYNGQWARPYIDKTMINSVITDEYDPLSDLAVSDGWKNGITYNGCATLAGTFCYGDAGGGGEPEHAMVTQTGEDICPAGWRLPIGIEGGLGDYAVLINAITGTDIGSTDVQEEVNEIRKSLRLALPYHGDMREATVGLYSNTWNNYLWVDSTSMYSGTYEVAYYYAPIRCIAK